MDCNRPLRTVAFGIIATLLLAAPAGAQKKKKAKGGDAPAPTMTFEPEETGQPAATPPAAAPPPAAGGKRKPAPGGDQPVDGSASAPRPAGPPPVAGPPSKTLERAIKLYESDDFYSATIELNKVIEGQSQDDEGNKQRAEFYMGKALFNLKFFSASLSYFDRIVQKGPSHAYYARTLQWLASLQEHLPESAGVLDRIGKYTRSDLDQPALESVRDQLFYLLGRFHYSKSNFKEALDLFHAVPDKSEYYAKAKFFEGMTFIRQYQAKPASEAFKAILRKAQESPDRATREFEQLANVSLARTFYSLHQFPQAIKYYDKVPQSSPDWLPSLFEASWAHFQMDNDSKALGNIHTINAPYFENEFYPESIILKAVIYFGRCNFDRSKEALDEFNQTYPALKREIDRVIQKYPDNAEFFSYVVKIRNGEANLSERVQRATAGALSDKTLAKNIEYVSELDRELKSVERAEATWKSTAIAGNILQDLTLQKSLAANEAGGLARERLKRLSEEINELNKQAIKVEYETLNKQKSELEAQAGLANAGAADELQKRVLRGGQVDVDDEDEKWPFDGEYWKDELGYYRFAVQNKCIAKR